MARTIRIIRIIIIDNYYNKMFINKTRNRNKSNDLTIQD